MTEDWRLGQENLLHALLWLSPLDNRGWDANCRCLRKTGQHSVGWGIKVKIKLLYRTQRKAIFPSHLTCMGKALVLLLGELTRARGSGALEHVWWAEQQSTSVLYTPLFTNSSSAPTITLLFACYILFSAFYYKFKDHKVRGINHYVKK